MQHITTTSSLCYDVRTDYLKGLSFREFLPPLVLSVDETGFRPNHSICGQVLALTAYITNGFQTRQRTGAVFLDFAAAYNTIWHTGLRCKVSLVIP